MIKIEKIGKVFNPHSRNRNEVLKGVTFELPNKGLICIYGKSGSGKTTLLNIIGGLDKQDSGRLYIDSEEVTNNADKIRNRKIGFVFQNYYLEKGYTISEIMHNSMNLAGFKDEAEIEKRTKEVLDLVDMTRFKNKQGDALSGGQKQRVAIARALIKGSDIILADEPTGNLDADNTMHVMDILKEISATRLVVVVTHEVTLIKKYADSYIQLVDGQLTDKDVISEVFDYETAKNNIYVDENSAKELSEGNLSLKIYGDTDVQKEDIKIITDKGKIFIQAGKNVKVIDDRSEKKIIFKGADEEKKETDNKKVPFFTQSQNTRNGRLFTFKNIFKAKKSEGEEKFYSTANIFKQIFIFVIAVVMCFFSMAGFDIMRSNTDNKMLNDNSIYVSLNSYSYIKQLPEELYKRIDFFETQKKEGDFSYNDLTALSGIKAGYTPKAIERDDTAESLGLYYGKMPEENEVLITRGLADELKKQFRIEELSFDKAMLMVIFEGKYAVSGIIESENPAVFMDKRDYVNFLGVYDQIKFVDSNKESPFLEPDYMNSTFSSEIVLSEDDTLIDETDEVYVEISRNALYKMMKDTVEADYKINSTNSALLKTKGRTNIEIENSNFYVRKFAITRDVMDTDLRIYVHPDALDNIFVHLDPNLNSLREKEGKNGRSLEYYFEISAENSEQLSAVKEKLATANKIYPVDVAMQYETEQKEAAKEAFSGLTIFFVVAVLLFTVYFFIEKSGSIKNAKEYGVFRAIGVNKSNLLYKETLIAFFDNMITYFIFYLITSVLMCIRYGIMNVAFGAFIGILALVFVISFVLLMLISLIPYLFVLYETPSEVLSRYDI